MTMWRFCSEVPLPLGTASGLRTLTLLALYTGIVIAGGTYFVRQGRAVRTMGFMLMSLSPLTLAGWAWLFEGRNPLVLLDPARQSLALYLDFGFIGLLALGARYWRRLPNDRRWFRGWRWLAVSLALGLAQALWFREHEAYAYDLWRYDSASKLFHDVPTEVGYGALVCLAAAPFLRHLSVRLVAPGPETRGLRRLASHVPVGPVMLTIILAWLAASLLQQHLDITFLHPAQLAWTHGPVTRLPDLSPAAHACG